MIFRDKFQRIYELAALVTVKVRRAIQATLKPLGITVDQFGTLMVLTGMSGISQRELAGVMETDTTTAMVICDGLEKRGLISRVRDTTDRRTNHLLISEKGKELFAKAYAVVERAAFPLTEVLTPEEVELITPSLEKLAMKARELASLAKAHAQAKPDERSIS
jgi:DNA-binding MarR family transcriptional regulator